MSDLDSLVEEVLANMSSLGVRSGRVAWLASTIDADDLSITLDDDSVSMGEGMAELGDEQVYVRNYDSASKTLTLAPDGRGWNGTTAASHAANTRIYMEPVLPRLSVKKAVKNAVLRSYPTIFGVGSTTFTYDMSKLTYALPADAERVLSVTYDTYGSTGAWPTLAAWSFDGAADTTAYPTGKTLTVNYPATPGRTVRVIYVTRPDADALDDGDFTDTGLALSARRAVVLGACADLARFMEASRLSGPATAAADEYDSKRPYLTGSKLANDLEAQFQTELMNEQRRLRQTYPARTHRRFF